MEQYHYHGHLDHDHQEENEVEGVMSLWDSSNNEEIDKWPADFRCPISMEMMRDPVTISSGVTYDRGNIEKWLFKYNKRTCPTTMQSLQDLHLTPNHTLKRLILSWLNRDYTFNHNSISTSTSHNKPLAVASNGGDRDNTDVASLLKAIESSPFKVGPLKKLRSLLESHGLGGNSRANTDPVRSSSTTGCGVLVEVLVQILPEITNCSLSSSAAWADCNLYLQSFRACEEALAILLYFPLSSPQDKAFQLLSNPETTRSMAILLQRGSTEARLYAVSIFRKMAAASNCDYWTSLLSVEGGLTIMDNLFISLLEMVSDGMISSSKSKGSSSCALQVMIDILASSKKSRLKAIQAGAVCVLVELLPESNKSKCERMLLILKMLCECAEGRLALVDHPMAIPAVSKKLLGVSNAATKLGIKILWLICGSHHPPSDRVLKELLVCGAVKKLLALLHMDGRTSTKDKVIKMFKSHGNSWRRSPCFPGELRDYLETFPS